VDASIALLALVSSIIAIALQSGKQKWALMFEHKVFYFFRITRRLPPGSLFFSADLQTRPLLNGGQEASTLL
jgi:hypothetical protein